MNCPQLTKLIGVSIAIGFALIAASSTLAGAPTGTSPADPLMVPTDSQTIAPNATLWFYFDYATARIREGGGFTRSRANVAVDANGVGGLRFGIYTPNQANDWLRDSTTAPAGFGTPYFDRLTEILVHDLYWSGGFNTSGRYFVAITNDNSMPVAFALTVTGDTVTLYPPPLPAPSPTLFVPYSVTPAPTGTIPGRIVFQTAIGGLIYTVNGDGSNLVSVSHGIDPAWSPDGKQITFARWDNVSPGVYIANADGSNERIVFGAPRVRSPRMSPDGKYIVFSQEKSKTDSNPIWKLGLVELATGKLTEPQCSQLCFAPSWRNDNVTLAYSDPGIGIMTTNIFSGPPSLVLGPTGAYWDANANIARPNLHMPPIQTSAWSPDGRRIVYSQPAHDREEVNVVNADGSYSTAVTSPDLIAYYLLDIAVHNVAPTWSPDSQQILFLSDRNGKWEFFVSDVSGSNLRQVLKTVTNRVPLRFDFANERMMDWTN